RRRGERACRCDYCRIADRDVRHRGGRPGGSHPMSLVLDREAPTVVEPRRPSPSGNSAVAVIVLIGLAVAGAWSVWSLGIDIATIASSFDNAVGFLSRIVPLDFPAFGETV